MTTWTQTQTLQHGSCTIIIHRPELTDSERQKREQQIRNAMGSAMREYIRRKEPAE